MYLLNPAKNLLLGDYTEPYAWFPEAASSFSADNDWLYGAITGVCFLFFMSDGVRDVLLCLSLQQTERREGGKQRRPQHTDGIAMVHRSVILLGRDVCAWREIGTWTIAQYPTALWNWKSKHKNGSGLFHYGRGTYHPELHLLVNEPTKLSMTSSDVLHALYVPAFRAKKDIVPGRYNYMWFKPTIASMKKSMRGDIGESTKRSQSTVASDWELRQVSVHSRRLRVLRPVLRGILRNGPLGQMQTVVVVHENAGRPATPGLKSTASEPPRRRFRVWRSRCIRIAAARAVTVSTAASVSGHRSKSPLAIKRDIRGRDRSGCR